MVFTLVPKEDAEEKDKDVKGSVESKENEGKTDDAYETQDDDVD